MSGGRRSNRKILTGGKRYVQKQNKKYGMDEVVFDNDSRQDYLTGFHKRKIERQKKAQVFIKEQDRLARIADRKRMRDERKQEHEERMKAFNDTVKGINNLDDSDEDDSWDGFNEKDGQKSSQKDGEDGASADDMSGDDEEKDNVNTTTPSPKGILRRKEVYKIDDPTQFQNTEAVIDEDTTVTVESVDNPLMANIQEISLEAKAKANYVDLSKADEILEKSIKRAQNYAVTAGVAKPKREKKKKFRYLTKSERRTNIAKQKVKKFKKKKDGMEKGDSKNSKSKRKPDSKRQSK